MFLIDDTKDADSEKPSVKEKGKPTLSLASDNYDKVVSYLKTTPNADINLVLDKYVVSAEMKKELIKLTK